MSRVYRALEKVEEERKQKAEEPSVKVFEEKTVPKKEGPALQSPEEKIEKLRLPSNDRQRIIGVIFNQLDVKPSTYSSEHYRYYQYYRK
jgi:hypothetical protein